MTLTSMTAVMFRMIEFPFLASTVFMDAFLISATKAMEEEQAARLEENSRTATGVRLVNAPYRQRPADTVVIRKAA